MKNSGLAFHCHHDALIEYAYDYDKRVEYIKSNKSENERELRLKLFKLIPEDKIPGVSSIEWVAYNKAQVAYDKACAAYDKAQVAYNEARVACNKAWAARTACTKAGAACDKEWAVYTQKFKEQIKKLHTELCPDCPWNGKTILNRKNDNGDYY